LVGPIAGDPMADPTELTQLFDVDVEDLARGRPFVATDWLGRLERRQAIEAQPFQHAADGGGRSTSAPICSPVWRCLRKASTAA
jgi:hypothetical protein